MVAEGLASDQRRAGFLPPSMDRRARSDSCLVVAIVGGLGAALSWAIATLASSRSSKLIGAPSVLAWVMIVGLAVSVVPAAVATPVNLLPEHAIELVLVGFAYTTGLLLAYIALTTGRVSLVAPVTATEGAVAALISVALGEPLGVATGLVLAVIATGVVLASYERAEDERRTAPAPDEASTRRSVLLAMGAAAAFSVGLVAAGRLGEAHVPPAWPVFTARVVGALAIAAPLLLTKRLRISRRAAPLVVVSGVLEALGSGLYVVAAADGVAPAAVLSSQFAAIAAVGAFVLFGERLQRVQVLGIVLIAVGVTVLAAAQA
jgi:drug/metabolite transporter (DMT)-like permease